jgi:threonine dehydratase
MEWQVPILADVLEARRRISPHLRPTPLFAYAALNELLGAKVFVKHENHQPVGAFKVRGGVNLISQLCPEERARGVIAASTGNHGQSIAYAARLFGVQTTICVPENANPVKVASMRGLGAELVFHGRDYDEAREHCEQLADEHGCRYVHSGNEPLLIAGVATETLEILEEQPQTAVIIVPIGGGSGAAGACVVAKAVNPAVRVIGVQSQAAPAAYRSWRQRRLVEDRMETFAEGLATRTAFELPQRILWQWLDDFRARQRRGDPCRAGTDDRGDAQPGRGGGCGAARSRASFARAAGLEAHRLDRERRERKPRAAYRRAALRARDEDGRGSRERSSRSRLSASTRARKRAVTPAPIPPADDLSKPGVDDYYGQGRVHAATQSA